MGSLRSKILQNSDETGKLLLNTIALKYVSVFHIHNPRWLGGAREDWCLQRFKWVLEHRELVLTSSWF